MLFSLILSVWLYITVQQSCFLKLYPLCNVSGKKKIFLLFPHCFLPFNCLPNDKILDWSELEAFANDRKDMTKNWNFIWEEQKT